MEIKYYNTAEDFRRGDREINRHRFLEQISVFLMISIPLLYLIDIAANPSILIFMSIFVILPLLIRFFVNLRKRKLTFSIFTDKLQSISISYDNIIYSSEYGDITNKTEDCYVSSTKNFVVISSPKKIRFFVPKDNFGSAENINSFINQSVWRKFNKRFFLFGASILSVLLLTFKIYIETNNVDKTLHNQKWKIEKVKNNRETVYDSSNVEHLILFKLRGSFGYPIYPNMINLKYRFESKKLFRILTVSYSPSDLNTDYEKLFTPNTSGLYNYKLSNDSLLIWRDNYLMICSKTN